MQKDRLLENLRTYFSDSELRDLCFSLDIDYETLAGNSKADKTRELVTFLERRERLSGLLEIISQLRPHVSWYETKQVDPISREQISASTRTQIGNVSAGRDAIVAGRDINLFANDRRARAERKTDEGRQKIQKWGERISEARWDKQAWHLLGFALQYTYEAIEIDPEYQRAWTLLADVYHRIGKGELAKRCLKKSYNLASPGPHHPGRFYRKVENNINTGYPFNHKGGLKRQSPPSWFEDKYQRYWTL